MLRNSDINQLQDYSNAWERRERRFCILFLMTEERRQFKFVDLSSFCIFVVVVITCIIHQPTKTEFAACPNLPSAVPHIPQPIFSTMVFYFVSDVVSPSFSIFMGAEKYESKYVNNTAEIEVMWLCCAGKMIHELCHHISYIKKKHGIPLQMSTWSNGVGRRTFGSMWIKCRLPTFTWDCSR